MTIAARSEDSPRSRRAVLVGWGLVVVSACGLAAPFRGDAATPVQAMGDGTLRAAADAARQALRNRYGESEAARIDRGVAQAMRLWSGKDGDAKQFGAIALAQFQPAGEPQDALFDHLELALERIGGYAVSLGRDLRRPIDLDLGPILPVDELLADYDPGAHAADDLFDTKVGFAVLLNFPLTTLSQRLSEGSGWSRRQWAETRLAQRFGTRVPAEVSQRINAAVVGAEAYVNSYNIYMHHLLDEKGRRPFPAGLRLISHWGLRDELKAHYADKEGLLKQRLIQKVMERIVRQEIPAAVVNNPRLDWNPLTNAVSLSPVNDADPPAGSVAEARAGREPDDRYARWLEIFRAERLADPYHPDDPTLIDRRFNVDREIPEAAVRGLFESILGSPFGRRTARLIEKRLKRPLEPFDVWYAGFKPGSRYQEPELDAITRKKYPTAAAYAADIPRLLADLGFSDAQAHFLAEHIEVDPARGAGHAMGAGRRDDKAHLRTRVGPGGMDYKGYNIAVHEMGHNVEQVFSLNRIDHTLLAGVPNTAFTEALAFVFQARDLKLLGLEGEDPSAESLKTLNDFWATREIAGVALVDMAAWRWLYAHPEATAAELRQAVVGLARDQWNRYYADLLGARDVPLLAIYSHMVDGAMYTPDYPLGHLIAFQIDAHLGSRADLGSEFERICRLGALTPDAWMRQAVGGPLSAVPLLEATEQALKKLGGRR